MASLPVNRLPFTPIRPTIEILDVLRPDGRLVRTFDSWGELHGWFPVARPGIYVVADPAGTLVASLKIRVDGTWQIDGGTRNIGDRR